ncbi:MAG TPA: nucleotidyltransferase family protein, partial [Pyrinomonadaceae bacterium]|nr:nucleotidyltransferase family protein [Pyrinomonadaceae bacterium]
MSSHKKAQKAQKELLLCCARTTASARLRELAATDVDWNYLFLLARRHAVVPLVYVQLERHAPALVPPHVLARFKKHYVENSAR